MYCKSIIINKRIKIHRHTTHLRSIYKMLYVKSLNTFATAQSKISYSTPLCTYIFTSTFLWSKTVPLHLHRWKQKKKHVGLCLSGSFLPLGKVQVFGSLTNINKIKKELFRTSIFILFVHISISLGRSVIVIIQII